MIVQAEVNTKTWELLSINGKKLGKCSMCGACCQARTYCAAENLVQETWDGVPVMRCKLHGPNKPISCVLFPLPDSELPDSCTMR